MKNCAPCCLPVDKQTLPLQRVNECYRQACCGVTASNFCVRRVRDDLLSFCLYVSLAAPSPCLLLFRLPSWTSQSVATLDVGMLGKTMVRFYTRRAVVQRVCLHLFPRAVFSPPAKNTPCQLGTGVKLPGTHWGWYVIKQLIRRTLLHPVWSCVPPSF